VDESEENDKTSKVELFEDGIVIQTDEPNSENRRWETTHTSHPGKHYYFAKVTQADGNMLWSAPVWVTVDEKLATNGPFNQQHTDARDSYDARKITIAARFPAIDDHDVSNMLGDRN
jgi:hypothetical protein